MWKDFFYYSKAERYAIIVLLFFIVLNLTLCLIITSSKQQTISDEKLSDEEQILHDMDSLSQRDYSNHTSNYLNETSMCLINFNPNTIDSLSLVRMGFPVRVVRNLLKYRRAGGSFKKVDDLAKIYGLTEKQFETVAPFVQLPTELRREKPIVEDDSTMAIKPQRYIEHIVKFDEGTQVDLNTVDTSDLKRIPGIGSGIARQIVQYRQRLGGFYEVNQLKDLPYVTDDMLPWFRLEEVHLEKIEINKAGLEQLRNHPYMNFYKAKVILEHRRKRGKINDISQLSLYEEFSDDDIKRLSPYLSFD